MSAPALASGLALGLTSSLIPAAIFACGNSLRGDDGVGLRIGRRIQEDGRFSAATVVLTHQLLPEHAESLSRAKLGIFIDCAADAEPGAVSTILLPHPSISRLPGSDSGNAFTHHFDPSSLLDLALELYGRAPQEAFAVTVGGACFELGETLTPSVEAAIPVAIETVRNQLAAQLGP